MEKITLTLEETEFPLVLKIYGAEGAKKQAIQMCAAQGAEITEENLTSCLLNLEEDLENQTAMLTEGEEE